MKIGDLVELSAKGKKIWWCKPASQKIGVVLEVLSKNKRMYPIRIKWFGGKSGEWHLREHLKFISKT